MSEAEVMIKQQKHANFHTKGQISIMLCKQNIIFSFCHWHLKDALRR